MLAHVDDSPLLTGRDYTEGSVAAKCGEPTESPWGVKIIFLKTITYVYPPYGAT
jgi:hypothetical protein